MREVQRRAGPDSGLRAGIGLILALSVWASPGLAQSPSPPPPAPMTNKSVHGTLVRVDTRQNSLFMKSDAGEPMAWRLSPRVITEAARFKQGDPVIVIYRQVGAGEKAITAVAFPGTATAPVYVNTTSGRIVFRSGASADGTCPSHAAGPVNETAIPAGGMTEIADDCWCCAPSDQTCTPANKSGLGQAFLIRCYP